jgi:hypothetical protein
VKHHRADIVALIFGLAFVIYGGTFIASELSHTDIEPAWISAIAFVTLGVVALTATLLRGSTPDALLDQPQTDSETHRSSGGQRVDDIVEG